MVFCRRVVKPPGVVHVHRLPPIRFLALADPRMVFHQVRGACRSCSEQGEQCSKPNLSSHVVSIFEAPDRTLLNPPLAEKKLAVPPYQGGEPEPAECQRAWRQR